MGVESGGPASQVSPGQFLVGGLVFLCALMIVVEAMVWFSQREGVWTNKSGRSNAAFNLAETGANRAQWMLQENPAIGATVLAGSTVAGYNFDQTYSDVNGGQYSVLITSGSASNTLVIESVGQDKDRRETRAVKATYSVAGASTGTVVSPDAVFVMGGASISGNNIQVEWGPVVSQTSLTTGGRTSPQFYSAGALDLDTNGPTVPNNDTPGACQWWSYNSNPQSAPTIDLSVYKSSAQATGTYFNSGQTWSSSPAGSSNGYTYYIDGPLTIHSPGIYIVGNLIVNGALSLPNGAFGSGSETIPVPPQAWKQYCNNWSYYRSTFDPGAPASFPGLNSSYTAPSTATYSASGVMVHGLLYIGGDMTSGNGGGGGTMVVGAIVGTGSASLSYNSTVHVLYDPSAMVAISGTSSASTMSTLARTAWKELASCTWTGTNPNCGN